MNLGEKRLSSELLSCGGSPLTTWVSWSNTLFHFGYGNRPVASSYWNRQNIGGKEDTEMGSLWKTNDANWTHQCDSQTPNVRANVIALPRCTRVNSFRLKVKKKKDQTFWNRTAELPNFISNLINRGNYSISGIVFPLQKSSCLRGGTSSKVRELLGGARRTEHFWLVGYTQCCLATENTFQFAIWDQLFSQTDKSCGQLDLRLVQLPRKLDTMTVNDDIYTRISGLMSELNVQCTSKQVGREVNNKQNNSGVAQEL